MKKYHTIIENTIQDNNSSPSDNNLWKQYKKAANSFNERIDGVKN